jgi:uncharacterized protein (DUF433 family)
MDVSLHILVLEDSVYDAELIEATLAADGLICDMVRVETREDFAAALDDDELPPLSRQDVRAELSLETSLELLETARRARWGRPAPEPPAKDEARGEKDPAAEPLDDADFSNEWPTLPGDYTVTSRYGDGDPDEGDDEDDAPAAPRWQDRLVFDFSVSETSPVVKGTWVTVRHVVSLIVDGWAWSDILRTHPELTEDDVRTCLAYTADQDDHGDY